MGKISEMEFKVFISGLFAAYPSASMSEATMPAYYSLLAHLSLPELRAATKLAIKESRTFVPSAPEILAMAQTGGEDPALKAHQAWPEVLKLASRSSAEHSDPVAKAAMMAMGGGQAWGTKTDQEMIFAKKDFVELYCQMEKGGGHKQLEAAPEVKALVGEVLG